ncbi:MAG: hypothetical protein AB7L90_21615 [Hyphomicrobiaceae bacterium]
MGLISLGGDILLALADTATGRKRRRYEHWVDIRSPREIVWEMLKSRDLVFDGPLPIRVIGEPVPGAQDLERVQIVAGSTRLVMLTRIVDERPGSAILYQLLPEGTDPALIEGDDDYVGFVLTDLANGTRLHLTRETSPRGLLSRLTVPMGLRSGGLRYKRKAEAMLRQALEQAPEPGSG